MLRLAELELPEETLELLLTEEDDTLFVVGADALDVVAPV